MAEEERRTFQNRVSVNWFWIFISFLLFLGGSLSLNGLIGADYPPGYDAMYGRALGASFFIALLGIFFIATFLKEAFYDAPSDVTLTTSAVFLRFRHKPPAMLEWKQIDRIQASVRERTIIPANPKLSGRVWFKKVEGKDGVFIVDYGIANALISRYKGNPISTEAVADMAAQMIAIEADTRPIDNLAYGLLAGLVSFMLLIGFLLSNAAGNIRLQYAFAGGSLILAVAAISQYRKGFHALKETTIERDQARVNISIWERMVGRKPVLRVEDIHAMRIFRDGALVPDSKEEPEWTHYAMFLTKDGKMYSLGPRSRAMVQETAAFVTHLGIPIII